MYDYRRASNSVVESLKAAYKALDYLPNGVSFWNEAHGGNKTLADANAKKVHQCVALLGEILASLPASVEYIVYGVESRPIKTGDRAHFVKLMAQHGFRPSGEHASPHTRPELRGQPTFEGLIGPMYGGAGVVRYETPAVYEQLSR